MTHFYLLVALNVLDAYLTVRFLALGVGEANPLLRFLMGKIGRVPALVVAKAAFIGLIWWLALTQDILEMLCLAYGALCVWNWRALERAKK